MSARRATVSGVEIKGALIGSVITLTVLAGGFTAVAIANAQDAPAPRPSVTAPIAMPSATPTAVDAPAATPTPTTIPTQEPAVTQTSTPPAPVDTGHSPATIIEPSTGQVLPAEPMPETLSAPLPPAPLLPYTPDGPIDCSVSAC